MGSRYIVHRGNYMQHGRGLGGILASLFKGLVPLLKSTAKVVVRQAVRSGKKVLTSDTTKKVAKKVLASAKKNVVKAGLNATLNAIQGKDVKAGAKADLSAAKSDLGDAIKSGLTGSGKRSGGRKALPISKRRSTKKKFTSNSLI